MDTMASTVFSSHDGETVAFLRLIAQQTRRRIVEADIAAVRVRFIGEIREESTFQPSSRTGQYKFTAVE